MIRNPSAAPVLADHVVGIVGGTGPQGRGLAKRFADAGLSVVIGSRDAERAKMVAVEIGPDVEGLANAECADRADIVVLAVPWEGHRGQVLGLASELVGKIVVDCVNPLGFDTSGPFALTVAEGSAAQQAQALLPDSVVTAAFHHLSAASLLDEGIGDIGADVLVLGDDRAATDLVQDLASSIAGCRGVYGGRLRNAGQVEAFTANLISINKRYRAHAGVRVTDLDADLR